jgi:hypothetical protein
MLATRQTLKVEDMTGCIQICKNHSKQIRPMTWHHMGAKLSSRSVTI